MALHSCRGAPRNLFPELLEDCVCLLVVLDLGKPVAPCSQSAAGLQQPPGLLVESWDIKPGMTNKTENPQASLRSLHAAVDAASYASLWRYTRVCPGFSTVLGFWIAEMSQIQD